MYITHSYIGTAKGRFRCLFFLLLEDYIEAQSLFGSELEHALERFARRMKDSGALIRPFIGDIESTRSQVLDKPWTPTQLTEIYRTPGLLMIDVDFDTFDPNHHPWLFIHLWDRLEDRAATPDWRIKRRAEDLGDALRQLSEAVCDADTDVFECARATIREDATALSTFAKVIEAKPGVFGFSIDLIEGAALIHRIWFKLTEGKRILPATVDSAGWATCPKCGIRFSTKDHARFDGRRHLSCGTYLEIKGG